MLLHKWKYASDVFLLKTRNYVKYFVTDNGQCKLRHDVMLLFFYKKFKGLNYKYKVLFWYLNCLRLILYGEISRHNPLRDKGMDT